MSSAANIASEPSADDFGRRWRPRLGRALGLIVASGGLYWWQCCQRVLDVARRAPTWAEGEVILVPGYRLRDDDIPAAYAVRLAAALRLWRPQRGLLLSGTAASRESQSEALAGFAHLCDLGLPPSAPVLLDSSARDTEENLRGASALLGRQSTVLVVSNRWHLCRCAMLIRRLNLPWKVCAAELRWRPDWFAWLALAREGLILLALDGAAAARLDTRTLLDNQR